MKFKFLKKAVAFVTAVAMSFGTIAVLPEECILKVNAESFLTNSDGTVSYNGHRYKVYNNVVNTYSEAVEYCKLYGGHLATISDSNENDFIYNLITENGFSECYFGFNDMEKEGVFQWVTDESISYTNWAPGEPNNDGGNEDHATFSTKRQKRWNDGNFSNSAFVCEWDYDSEIEKPVIGDFYISSAEELIALSKNNTLYGGYKGSTIHFTNDIDMSDIEWIPLGTDKVPFKGSIDGNGHTISNISMDNIPIAGLIGYLEADGIVSIENIKITDYKYNAELDKELIASVLIANANICNGGSLNITNISTANCWTNKMTATWFAHCYWGGIIGKATADANSQINLSNLNLDDDHNYYIYSADYSSVGGIIGKYFGSDLTSSINIDKCVSTSAVYSMSSYGYCSADAGGIIGSVEKGTINVNQCYVNDRVCGKSYYVHVGGVVGNVSSALLSITDCNIQPTMFRSECTNGSSSFGGFIGCISNSSGSSINNSIFSSNNTQASVKAGFAAFCSEGQLTVNNSYFNSTLTGINKNHGIVELGFLMTNWINSGLNNSYGITTEQMSNQSTYSGWDFDSIWVMTDDGYPQLRWILGEDNSSGYIKLSPLNEEGIKVGGGESILAYVYDKGGNRLSNVNLVWTSSDENIVAITESNNLGAVVEGKSVGEATIICQDTVSGYVGELNVVVSKYEISYNSQDQNKPLEFDYSDSYFFEDATVFNQKLAQASLALELSSWTTYDEKDVWTSNIVGARKDNLKSAFQVLGFENDEYTKYNVALSDNSDTVAFGIAQKGIIDDAGNESTIVAVAVRGGGYGGEWASNFRIGDNKKYASGFWDSSTGVYNYVNDYINKYAIEKDKLKIWIVGFSRGAAVANLTAARLCNNYSYKNIYAYTFATPQGYIFNNDEVSSEINYHNIHNIINPADLVPTVALSGWGFGRFGESHYINYGNRQYVKTLYYRERKEEYCVDPKLKTGVIAVDDFLLNILASTPAEYSTKLQPIIVSLLAGGFASGDMLSGGYDFDEYNFHSFFIELILEYSKLNNIEMSAEIDDVTKVPIVKIISYIKNLDKDERTIYGFTELLNGEMFSQHYGETYIAWLFSSDTTDIYYNLPFSYKTAIIDCPVDVYVYDENDTLVASIVNDKIVCDDITVSIFGEQKRIYFDSDSSYKIKLIGNDTGEMDYSVEERNSDGKVTRRVSYYDLPLENGKTYTGVVNDEVNTPSHNYDLSSDDGNHSSDFDTINATDEAHSIIINGGFASTPSAYPGEQITITALVPNDNSVFSKWETTSSVSLDDFQMPVAIFVMPNEDIEITAVNSDTSSKLSGIMVDAIEIPDFSADNTNYNVSLPYGTTAIPTVTATPANANADVNITQATSLTGTEAERTATITVTAEDGVTKTIYKVVFSIESHTHTLEAEYSSDETGHWYACSGCDEKVDFEAHTEDSGTVTLEPTETTEGEKTFRCTECGYVIRTEPIAVLDHTHTLATEYSSDETGHWYACSGCDEKVNFETHTEDSGTVTLEPTETTEGEKTFKCTECGYVIRTESIAMLDHTHTLSTEYSSDATGHWYACSGCTEKVNFEAHTEDSGTVTLEPTETTEGVRTYSCKVCGYVLRTEPISALGENHTHNYSTEWQTDSTSHWHECDCGERKDIGTHTEGSGVVTIQPTDTSTGIMTYYCTVCEHYIRSEIIPATEPVHTHSYGTTWKYDSIDHWHECSCGEKTDIAHHISNGGAVIVQPTATTTGVRVYSCSVCGYVMRTETIPATGSNYYPTYPSYPTYPTYPVISTPSVFTEKLNVNAEADGSTVTLNWDGVQKAGKYYVYQYRNGKYVKVKTTTDTSVTFKKLKNGETYKYLVRYTIGSKLSPTSYSGNVSLKVYYKPIPKPTAAKTSITLKWEAVPDAKKYAIYKYVDGKAVKIAETKKLSVKINKLTPDTEYKYIVRAYVDGKWTTMTKSDIVTIKTKAE